MATYLQGVTDYIPQVQPWTPNFNFYQSVLERKQGQYDRGWEQVNSMYNSILNAPMLREQNNARRDKFFKDIEDQIYKMGGVDLSLPQNVDAASQVFKPFYEDQNIVKDIGFTKKYQDELQRAEYLRTCTDPEKCGDQYWDGGVRALHYRAEDFVNASDEEALRMRNPEFTPYANVMEMATKAAKEADLNIEYDRVQGRYIVKTKNGPELVQPLMTYFMGRFGDNPKISKFFREKAYLTRKENPEQAEEIYNLALMQGEAETPEQLEQMVQDYQNRDNFQRASQDINNAAQAEEASFLQMLNRRKIMEKQIRNGGIVEGGPEDKSFRKMIRQIDEQKEVVDKVKDIRNSTPSTYTDMNGNPITPEALDGVVANSMMLREFNAAANTLAYKDYKQTLTADPYALAGYKNQLAMQKMAVQHQYKLTETAVKDVFDAGKEYRKYLVEHDYIDPKTGMPYYIDPEDQKHDPLPGGGMGQYDPADIAAMYRQSILSGSGVPNLSTSPSLNQDRINSSGNAVDGKDVMDPVEKAYYNMVMEEMPGSLQQGMPEETKKGFRSDVEDLIVTYTKKGAKADTRVSDAINQLDKEEISFAKFRNVVHDVITDLSSISESWKKEAGKHQTEIVKERLGTLLQLAADPNSSSNEAAIDAVVSIGNMISQNSAQSGDAWREVLKFGGIKIDDVKLPTTKDWANDITAENFKPFLGMDVEKIIAAAGGTRKLYELFANDKKVTQVKRYDGKGFINSDEINMISDDQYTELGNRGHDYARYRSTGELIKAGFYDNRQDNPQYQAEYNWYMEQKAKGGIKPLSKSETEAKNRYEWYTSQPYFDTGFDQLGLNTAIPELQEMNRDDLHVMGLIEWQFNAAEKMKSNFTNQMNEVAESFSGRKSDESDRMLGSVMGESWNSLAQRIIADNIWDPTLNNGWGGLTNSDDIYQTAAERGAYAWYTGEYIFDSNPTDWASSYSWTIPELEETYMDSKLDGEGLKKLLQHSELASGTLPKVPSGGLGAKLWEWYDSAEGQRAIPDGPVNGKFYINNIGDTPEMAILLHHPDTKTVRDGDYVLISNPAFLGEKSYKYNLSNYETYKGFENMFEQISDNLGYMRSEFMQKAQKTAPENFALPSQYLADAAGNFNFASGSITNGTVTAGLHNQALNEVVPLLNELNGNYDNVLDSYGKGLEQGDEKLLQLLVSTFDPEIEKKWKDSDLKKGPMINFEIDPVYGNLNLSRITVKLDPTTKHNWLKEMGPEFASYDSKAGKWNYSVPDEATYYIANSRSDIIRKTRPNPYHLLTGLSSGEMYVDDTFWDEFGGKLEFQRKGQEVNVFQTSKIWDSDTKSYIEYRNPTPMTLPLNGTNWEMTIKSLYDEIFRIPQINAEAISYEKLITDPNYLRNQE